MKKLFNVFTIIVIGVVFLTVISSSVESYRFNANGWNADTRETVRGSGVTYTEFFNSTLTVNPRFTTSDISEWGFTNYTVVLSYDLSEKMLQVTNQSVTYPYVKNTSVGVLTTGHKYYARYDYYTTDSNIETVYISIGNSSISETPVINQNGSISGLSQPLNANPEYMIQFITIDTLQIYSLYVDNIYLMDLTDIFGAGNEPTAEQVDYWYQDWNNLVAKPLDNLKTLDGMVDLFPLVFTIIIIAGSIMFIKSKQE